MQDVKTGGIRNKLISKRYQHFRERDLSYGLQDSLCTLALQLVFATYAAPQQDHHAIRAGG